MVEFPEVELLMLHTWSVSLGSAVLFRGFMGGWGRERIVALREEVRR